MLNRDYSPIIIPTLNRYEHLKKLVDSLLQCEEAKNTELVIGLDYPPNEKYTEGYERIKSFLPSVKGFGKVTILESDHNLGFDKNYQKLREYVEAQGYDAFIFSEDDNVFAPAFLSYMNWGVKTFRYDNSVLAICSYRENDKPIPNYPNNFYKAGGVRPYGFAMWLDRYKILQKRTMFDNMKRKVDEMPFSSVSNLEKVRVACKYLYLYESKTVHGDFCMGQMCIDDHMFCITPVKSLAKNIGSDGSGLHGANADRQQKELARVLDDAKTFVPIWTEPDLYTRDVIAAEKLLAKEQRQISIKQFLRYCFMIVKFVIYKTTGKIITYKQN